MAYGSFNDDTQIAVYCNGLETSAHERRNCLRNSLAMTFVMFTLCMTAGCQNGPSTSSAPLYGQSTIQPPGTANTALANPGAFAAGAPIGTAPLGSAPPNGTAQPINNWNSPSIFGGSAPPPVNGTAWNPNQPPNPNGAQGSIFDQAPATQQQGIFDSFAGPSSGPPGGSFNPSSGTRGYESPNSSFVSATPAHSANRAAPINTASGGSWWDRLTGTSSTVPPAGNPGWNQSVTMNAPTNATAFNDPRNPNFQRPPIPNPNATANGWNISAPPNPNIPNPLNTAPNYTNYGSPAPNYPPNNIGRTLPVSNSPLQPTNTLPAGWSNGGAAAATPPPATGPAWVKSLEDLPPAR